MRLERVRGAPQAGEPEQAEGRRPLRERAAMRVREQARLLVRRRIPQPRQ